MPTTSTTELATARGDIERAMTDLLAVPETALERPWTWPGYGEADGRYGFFRIIEDLEGAAAAGDTTRSGRPPAEAIVVPATLARWDLIGVLAPLSARELDADPGDAQWTIRQTVAHAISVQHAYAVWTGWWRTQRIQPGETLPTAVPDDLGDPAYDDDVAGDGTPDEIRARLHRAQDEAAAGLIDLTRDELGLGARWSGMPVTVGFRQARWSSHLIEHTVQVDKTLVWLGRQPSEVERLVRLVAAAWGRLEGTVWPRPLSGEALARAVDAARRARETAASVRAAASA